MAGANVIGPGSEMVTRAESAGLIYVREAWGDDWQLLPYAVWEQVNVVAGSDGSGRLEFSIPYGRHKPTYATAFEDLAPLALMDWWAMLVMVDPQGGVTPVFVGRVAAEDRQIMGSQAIAGVGAPLPKGWQRWYAYDGHLLLRKRAVSRSWWDDGDEGAVELAWDPGFNKRGPRGMLVGNRSAEALDAPDEPTDGTYVFGGTNTWTRRQAIDYVMARFLALEDGPAWTLGGQVDALAQELEDVEPETTRTVEDLLRVLIPRGAGLDFGVIPTYGEDAFDVRGFEVHVFALIGTDVTFRGAQLPRNPLTTTIKGSDMADVDSVRVSRDDTHRAARVRLVGARVVVCATLRGPELAGAPTGDVLTSPVATLLGHWTSAEESAYKAGSSAVAADGSHEVHDAARAADRFGAVYQRYGARRPWAQPAPLTPKVDGQGQVIPGEAAPHQNAVRSTLSWLPLREGFDYSADPPTDRNPATAEPDFRAPLVIANDRRAEIAGAGSVSRVYAPVDRLGVGVSVQKDELGVQLHAHPNHRLARGRWDPEAVGTSESGFNPADDAEEHAVDPRTLAATVAWRSDQRLVLEAALDADHDDGSVIELARPDAELWWLAPDTIVDVSSSGQPVTSGPAGRVLRNDTDRLAAAMAGAVARYLHGRARATVSFRGWRPWVSLLGTILLTVEEGGETHGVNAPITSVELHAGRDGSPRTVIRAGYAL